MADSDSVASSDSTEHDPPPKKRKVKNRPEKYPEDMAGSVSSRQKKKQSKKERFPSQQNLDISNELDDSDESGAEVPHESSDDPDEPGMHGDPSDSEADADDSQEEDQQFAALRKEMSEMPLEDLQKLKEMVGVKAFSEAMRGGKKSEKRPKTKEKRTFKRENKNRPMEMSSKKPVKLIPANVKKSTSLVRDPRFDDLSGEYSESFFSNAYSFIGDIKQREKEKITKRMQKESNPEKQQQMKQLVNRMTQKEKVDEQKAQRQQQERKRKKEERELIKQGKKPFYLKSSEKKKLELAEKYEQLSSSGKLDKYLAKKRKKNAAKDRKKLPGLHS